MAAAVFGTGITVFPAEEAQAATAETSDDQKVPFTDKSGKYLVKVKKDWYLKSSTGQPLTGVQLLYIPKTDNLMYGYYMFDGTGKLIQKTAVYDIRRQTVGRVTFNGYYITSASGRFLTKSRGLVYLKNYSCGKVKFTGIFYHGDYGELSASAQVRYLSARKIGGVSLAAGFYYFNKYGQLCTSSGFHYLNQTVEGHRFLGNYYFGGKNGVLYRKAGWVTINNKKYYLSSYGRRYQNCWKKGYYLLSDGTIAKNQKLPDGTYVDCDGHRCEENEFRMNDLKSQIKSITGKYSGTWSVYVKDLNTGDVVNLNEKAMYPASVIKAFVMASTFDQIKQKKLSYNSTVKSLLKSMITVSDNESYNQLVRLNSSSQNFVKGTETVNAYLKKNGYTNTACHTTLHPAYSSPVRDGKGSNTSSAKDCGLLLESIYRGTCVSAVYSKEMLNLLLNQTRRWKIPAGVPSGIKVANKTGETSTTQNDMAIVYGKKTTYVICIFSSGVTEYYGINGIKNISRCVYNYLN